MNISYEAYRVFYYTAKARSFTQAANALGNSLPKITRIIKNLERELGCPITYVSVGAERDAIIRREKA